jgi:hypothetical protein
MIEVTELNFFVRGMTLMFSHIDGAHITLARLEICQTKENGPYGIFLKSLSRTKSDICASEQTLNRLNSEQLKNAGKDITRNFFAFEDNPQDAVIRTIVIENDMLGRDWTIFNRERARGKDGLETIAVTFGIGRVLPSAPVAQRLQVFPTHDIGD